MNQTKQLTEPAQLLGYGHSIGVLALHPPPTIELAVPLAVFGSPPPPPNLLRASRDVQDRHDVQNWYEVRVCSTEHYTFRHPLVAGKEAHRTLEAVVTADTIIVAARPEIPPDPNSEIRRALQDARARRARIVAVGAGAFTLASAGVLAGRSATTHWSVADELRRRYPEVIVDDRVLYVEDEGIYTCAGAAATLDLCLDLVRQDHGSVVANAIARWLVAPPQRTWDQLQSVTMPVPEIGDRLSELLDWALVRLDQRLTLTDLAQAAGMSPRTLARRFHASLGTTPLQWLLAQRIRLAQELLESTDQSIDRIAERSGFGTVGNLRHHFTRVLGLSPRHYRQGFRADREFGMDPGR